MSESLARKNRLPFDAINPEDYAISDAQGEKIPITGKARIKIKILNSKKFFIFDTLLCDTLDDEKIIIGWRQMVEWGILPKSFPLPIAMEDNVDNNDVDNNDNPVSEIIDISPEV